jgi:hypothetical protein
MTQTLKAGRALSVQWPRRGGDQSFLHLPEDNYADPLKEKASTVKRLLRQRHIESIQTILVWLIENSEGPSHRPSKSRPFLCTD